MKLLVQHGKCFPDQLEYMAIVGIIICNIYRTLADFMSADKKS